MFYASVFNKSQQISVIAVQCFDFSFLFIKVCQRFKINFKLLILAISHLL